ncbi:MAG: 18S rRNA maturation protein [Piccolia ochrophora]|nr:MAG: 18S rRNA maturation protein [Piccolia ochrophora]
MGDLSNVHPARRGPLRRYDPPKRRKRPTLQPGASSKSSINTLRREIRSITRLLAHSQDLPADVRMENERALAAYNQEVEAVEQENRRQKMIKKYHMVRFFERKKATRLLKRLQKQMMQDQSGDSPHLKQQLHEAQVDLNYTLYHPLDQKYVALYGSRGGGGETEDTQEHTVTRERPSMWKVVESMVSESDLQALRDGKSGHGVATSGPSAATLSTQPKEKRQHRHRGSLNQDAKEARPSETEEVNVEKSGEDSDGEFFET